MYRVTIETLEKGVWTKKAQVVNYLEPHLFKKLVNVSGLAELLDISRAKLRYILKNKK